MNLSRYINTILSLILIGCSSIEHDNKLQRIDSINKKDLNSDSIRQSKHINNKPELKFDTTLFIAKLQEFIPTITSLKKDIHCETKLIEKKDTVNSYYQDLLITESNTIQMFKFDLGDHFKNIEVYQSNYSNPESIQTAFRNFQETANGLRDESPCLTKTNDFVIRSDKTIFWLNGACYYPYNNFIKICRLFESSLIGFNKIDSVKCKCGGGNVTFKP